ncbi:TetR/AcrR family transcriptional regulator [Novosphingobium mangrovi (ex Hu et al. 2023)]|uniref:TetR/AcrR family transcriptional regulator n=1 Tax=Novosphingobium mangrovi (ex Hu et al. 2023) TaxID=2930094 RepID=A0ABT0AEN2_9SPHN|nr:TetR/AcrR family transcriptional regulator [Novosphingobium mangrovi (ex Hu et al. 2023)]MCJ1961650.1 TetR/AcrR family transcriptional regulator [Novosphingobium mangrovi (ex Hu et al. 2023)]
MREGLNDTNQQGQKLGKKGKITRERILSASRELIADPACEFSLSAVARHTGLRMSSIYTYFADLPDLFLAVLDPVAREAEEAYLTLLRTRWEDGEIDARATELVQAFYAYWERHSRLLHLRNRLADQHERSVLLQRIAMARTVVRLLGWQMGGDPDGATGEPYDLASVLYTGLERVVTIATDTELKACYPADIKPRFEGATLRQQSRLLALAIKDQRAAA